MRSTGFIEGLKRGGHVLCLGAHSDDIEIGCGGTLLKLMEAAGGLSVSWVVLSASGRRETEARTSAEHILAGAKQRNVIVEDFRNGYFPYIGADIKDFFESLKQLPPPDLVLTHCRDDLHQDHRTVAELTWNTFRDHAILEYEIPKYDGDLGTPNVFVTLTEAHVEGKIAILERYFESQREKQWFDAGTFRGLSRFRGVECNSPTGFAEAFYGRKIILG